MPSKKYEIDMCNGAIFPKLIGFTFPLMASGILQLLFNTADIIVVGRFVGSTALAAVGSTSSMINFLINMFVGLSIGAGVVTAHYFGAGQKKGLSETVHTAIMISIIGGILLLILGLVVSKPVLKLMGTPDDVINQSVLYIRIYFLSVPGLFAYNFGSAILRAVGDTKRPMYFLLFAGILNVLCNLFFVIVLKRGVDGVAMATGIAQYVSATLVILCLVKTDSDYKLEFSKIKIYPQQLVRILKIGVPAGIQGMLFSVSNMLVQSSVNSFGSVVMAGNTAAQNIEAFVYTSMNATSQAATTFVSQNYGAKKFDRIMRIRLECLALVAGIGLVLGFVAYLFCDFLVGFYTTNPQVIQTSHLRLSIILRTYFICGLMDVMAGVLRGLNHSSVAMFISLIGACGFRLFWIFTVFAFVSRTLQVLYVSYPVSWFLTFSAHTIFYFHIIRKIKKTKV